MKKCAAPGCGLKELNEFHHDRTRQDRRNQYCKKCVRARSKKKYDDKSEVIKGKTSEYYRKVKREAMSHYGGVCQCCGEARIEFLAIDHINQDGADHRREMGFSSSCTGFGFYLWLRKNNWPDLGLQVLCANCNSAKGRKGSHCQCPHITEREPNLINGLGI